jgi:hypothetical protein
MILAAAASLASCRASEQMFYAVSVEADNFQVLRRISTINAVDHTVVSSITGWCAFWPEPSYVRIVCRTSEGYTQHTFGLSATVTFSVEQLIPTELQ